MTAREFKGLLDSSHAGAQFKYELRARLAKQARAMRATPALALHDLLAAWTPDLATRSDVPATTGLSLDQLRALQANTLAPVEVPAAMLLALADALRIPGRVLLDAVRASAARWIEPLVHARSAGLSPGMLAHLAGRRPVRSDEDIRSRVTEEMAEHAAALEALVCAREAEQAGEGRS